MAIVVVGARCDMCVVEMVGDVSLQIVKAFSIQLGSLFCEP